MRWHTRVDDALRITPTHARIRRASRAASETRLRRQFECRHAAAHHAAIRFVVRPSAHHFTRQRHRHMPSPRHVAITLSRFPRATPARRHFASRAASLMPYATSRDAA